jgi:hypothetical protein
VRPARSSSRPSALSGRGGHSLPGFEEEERVAREGGEHHPGDEVHGGRGLRRRSGLPRPAGSKYVQALADDAARARSYSKAVVCDRLGVTGIPSPEPRSTRTPGHSLCHCPQWRASTIFAS